MVGVILFRSGGIVKAGVAGAGIGFSAGNFSFLGVKAGSFSFAAADPGETSLGLRIDSVVLGISVVTIPKTKISPSDEQFLD